MGPPGTALEDVVSTPGVAPEPVGARRHALAAPAGKAAQLLTQRARLASLGGAVHFAPRAANALTLELAGGAQGSLAGPEGQPRTPHGRGLGGETRGGQPRSPLGLAGVPPGEAAHGELRAHHGGGSAGLSEESRYQ